MVGRTESGSRAETVRRLATAATLAVIIGLVGLAMLVLAPRSLSAQEATGPVGQSGLPLPRFVSLKSDKINVRRGPGRDYGVAWIYTRSALPVEIVAEFENWRRVRDSDGEDGWVFHSLLSGERTALVAPWAEDTHIDVFRRADKESPVVARVGPRVLVSLSECNGTWCGVTVNKIEGWIDQKSLWGVYPDERVED